MIIRREGKMTMSRKLFGGKGEVVIEPLFMQDEFTTPVRFCARIVLVPGSSIGLHTHENEDELYFILSGSGTVKDEESETCVSKGHSILTRSGESHSLENTGTEPMTLLAVIPQSHTS